jgi:hypothetical protein
MQAENAVGDLIGQLTADGGLQVTAETVTYLPDPASTLNDWRIDRPALRFLLASMQENRLPGLDDLAGTAERFDSASEMQITLFLASSMLGGANLFDVDEEEFALLKLYASLTPAQQRTARNPQGFTIPASGLNPDGSEALRSMVYGAHALDFRAQGERRRRRDERIASEPTVMFGSGIPGNLQVSFRVQATPQWMGRTQGSEVARQTGSRQLAWQLEQPDRVRNLVDRFLLGQEEELTVELVAATGSGGDDLEVTSFDPNGQWITYGQLPTEFQQRVETERSEIRARLDRRNQERARRSQGDLQP